MVKQDNTEHIDDYLEHSAKDMMDQIDIVSEFVPFGNSAYQDEHMADDKVSPFHSVRHVCLNARTAKRALYGAHFSRRKVAIEIEMKRAIINSFWFRLGKTVCPWYFKFKEKSIINEIEESCQNKQHEEKLIRDSLIKIKGYEKKWKNLPKPANREEYESSMRTHYIKLAANLARVDVLAYGRLSEKTIDHMTRIELPVEQIAGSITYNQETGRVGFHEGSVEKFPEISEFTEAVHQPRHDNLISMNEEKPCIGMTK